MIMLGISKSFHRAAGRIDCRTARRTFFDFAPLHIITTNTLATISPSGRADLTDAARFRTNLIVDCPDAGDAFVENAWVGRTLLIGCDLFVRIITPTPRCAIPTLEHRGLPENLRRSAYSSSETASKFEGSGSGLVPVFTPSL
jgi:uncharacterized protein YcbX